MKTISSLVIAIPTCPSVRRERGALLERAIVCAARQRFVSPIHLHVLVLDDAPAAAGWRHFMAATQRIVSGVCDRSTEPEGAGEGCGRQAEGTDDDARRACAPSWRLLKSPAEGIISSRSMHPKTTSESREVHAEGASGVPGRAYEMEEMQSDGIVYVGDGRRLQYVALPSDAGEGCRVCLRLKRNVALEMASNIGADAILFFDDDDWRSLDASQAQIDAMRVSGADVCSVQVQYMCELDVAGRPEARFFHTPDGAGIFSREWGNPGTALLLRHVWEQGDARDCRPVEAEAATSSAPSTPPPSPVGFPKTPYEDIDFLRIITSDAPVLLRTRAGHKPCRIALLDSHELARQNRHATVMTVRLCGFAHEWRLPPIETLRNPEGPDAAGANPTPRNIETESMVAGAGDGTYSSVTSSVLTRPIRLPSAPLCLPNEDALFYSAFCHRLAELSENSISPLPLHRSPSLRAFPTSASGNESGDAARPQRTLSNAAHEALMELPPSPPPPPNLSALLASARRRLDCATRDYWLLHSWQAACRREGEPKKHVVGEMYTDTIEKAAIRDPQSTLHNDLPQSSDPLIVRGCRQLCEAVRSIESMLTCSAPCAGTHSWADGPIAIHPTQAASSESALVDAIPVRDNQQITKLLRQAQDAFQYLCDLSSQQRDVVAAQLHKGKPVPSDDASAAASSIIAAGGLSHVLAFLRIVNRNAVRDDLGGWLTGAQAVRPHEGVISSAMPRAEITVRTPLSDAEGTTAAWLDALAAAAALLEEALFRTEHNKVPADLIVCICCALRSVMLFFEESHGSDGRRPNAWLLKDDVASTMMSGGPANASAGSWRAAATAQSARASLIGAAQHLLKGSEARTRLVRALATSSQPPTPTTNEGTDHSALPCLLAPLVACIEAGDHTARRRAAGAIYNCVAGESAELRQALVEAGAVDALARATISAVLEIELNGQALAAARKAETGSTAAAMNQNVSACAASHVFFTPLTASLHGTSPCISATANDSNSAPVALRALELLCRRAASARDALRNALPSLDAIVNGSVASTLCALSGISPAAVSGAPISTAAARTMPEASATNYDSNNTTSWLGFLLSRPFTATRASAAQLVSSLSRCESRHFVQKMFTYAPGDPSKHESSVSKKRWARGSIVYYTGRSLEAWGPESLETGGLGGSETAVLQLAKHWVQLLRERHDSRGEGVGGGGCHDYGERGSCDASARGAHPAPPHTDAHTSSLPCGVVAGGDTAMVTVYLRLSEPPATACSGSAAVSISENLSPKCVLPANRKALAFLRHELLWYGVRFVDISLFNPNDIFDTLIVWRSAELLELSICARQVILDLHDVPIPTELTPRRLSKVSHILVKSPFHASTLPRSVARAVANTMLRVEVIPNGVDTLAIATARTEVDGERAGVPVIDAGESVHTNGGTDPEDPVLIYTSSYDRGLEAMLRYGWPLILDRLPNASLHLYYGWQTHELRFPRSEWRESMRELIANSASVFDHGRVSQPELLKVKARAHLHYYVGDWPETDCIAVRESAFLGCIPLTSTIGALGDPNKDYTIKIEGPPKEPKTQRRAAIAAVEILKGILEKGRRETMVTPALREETWERVAARWLRVIDGTD